jgi:hypothetical protein
MMLKVRQGLALQQSPKDPGLVSRFLQGNQALNLTEEYQPINKLLWECIFEDRKVSGVLGTCSWLVWIHEELQLDQFHFVRVRSINLFYFLYLGNKRNHGEGSHV